MKKLLQLTVLFGGFLFLHSQNVTVDQTTYTVEQLVTDVLVDSPCANVFNITSSTGSDFGSNNGIGLFEEPSGTFPFAEGVVLATGTIDIAPGPNNNFDQSGGPGWPGDPDLAAVSGVNTNNATIIEFDFIPNATEISFRFLMASEEYAAPGEGSVEFECTFSDVFAFLLTDSAGITTNLAVLPDGVTPILVTTVHPDNGASCGAANPQYFSQYQTLGNGPTGYDGYTRSFTANSPVTPGETYHIKLAIADASDSAVHSGVFLEAGSFAIGLDLGNDITINAGNASCEGDTVTLDTGSPGADHTWFLDGVEIVGETDSTLDVTVEGTYSVDVEFSAGCSTSDEIFIEFVPIPIANTGAPLLECSSTNTAQFDLTENDDDILGAQTPGDYTITYFESQADADANTNALAIPYTNTSNPQTIYARIEANANGDCYDTSSFEISVANVTFNDPITDLEVCDDDTDGIMQFTLANKDVEVATSAGFAIADVTITYHETLADADAGLNPLADPYTNTANPQTIFARLVDNSNTSCFGSVEINLVVNETPQLQDVTLIQCDEDGTPDGLTEYNLEEANTGVVISGVTAGLDFTYYLTLADAIAAVNPVGPFFTNTVNPQDVFVRVENATTGCFNTAIITLDVTATDIGDVSLETCDDDFDGFAEFTLSDADADVLNGLPAGLTVAYYETANDAQLEINQLPNNYTNVVANVQTIFVRVEDANDCFGIANVDLVVNPLPENNTVNDIEFCSDDPNIATFDLMQFDIEVLGTQPAVDFQITYHESQADADANANALVSPYSNTSNPQTIFVRVENINTNCAHTLINFEISVLQNPIDFLITPFELCDDDADGFVEFT
ncbi:MAG: choice-of-anchor L domain-containing protein, partial [bacterium]